MENEKSKRPPGRPRRSDKRSDRQIFIRLTVDEKFLLEKAAILADLKTADFVRTAALEKARKSLE